MDATKTPELDVLVTVAMNLREQASAPSTVERMIQSIAIADELERMSHARLRDAVLIARANGVSWQLVGDTLGMSRQAAFKKFSPMHDQSRGDTEVSQPTIGLLRRTENVFTSLNSGDYDAVKSLMTYSCSRTLTKSKLMRAWDEVVSSTGRFESHSDTVLQAADGRDIVERFVNRHLIVGVVGQTSLHHEAGDWIGRVAFNDSGKITGIVFAPEGSANLAL